MSLDHIPGLGKAGFVTSDSRRAFTLCLKWLPPLVASLTLSTGCASTIYKSGRFHGVLKSGSNRSEIRAVLGEPVESGQDRDFGTSAYDDFVVRGPVCDPSRAAGASIGAGMTFGLSEFIALPQALWWCLTDRECKRVRVHYSMDWRYKLHFVEAAERTSAFTCEVPHVEQGVPADRGQPFRSE